MAVVRQVGRNPRGLDNEVGLPAEVVLPLGGGRVQPLCRCSGGGEDPLPVGPGESEGEKPAEVDPGDPQV
jgi:hypothetical protein